MSRAGLAAGPPGRGGRARVLHRDPRGPARARGRGAYAVGVVRLTEGVSLLGRIVDVPFDTLKAGLPLRFRPLEIGGQTMIGFGPA